MLTDKQLEHLLAALGELLEAEGVAVRILIVGGASLSLAGWIPPRATEDVDVLARVTGSREEPALEPPETLPPAFFDAVTRVARDFDLPGDWLNTQVAAQWRTGLPPGAASGLGWRRHGTLEVALAGRSTMIALKLFALVDRGPDSVHAQDLVALAPTDEELEAAARWVRSQDAGPDFASHLDEALTHVRSELGRDQAEGH